jgi:cyclophilin family peptidyl-prolyl cis-trans isomerase
MDIELYRNETPLTVTNFLKYVDRGSYNNSIIHRSAAGFVIQGGGFCLNGTALLEIADDPPVQNEPGVSNLRGTVAMAKLGGNPNSATSQWFVNLGDNSSNLDAQNGGFTVFGEVAGNGMRIVDRIASYSVYNATAQLGDTFGELPLKGPSLTKENLILFSKVRALRAGTIVEKFDFSTGKQGFSAGFADLPAVYDASLYGLVAEERSLPANFGTGKGLYISGANRSDDLWMFWKKKITGLAPNTRYEITMDLELASNETTGAVGVGGSPAESVFLKTGATAVEPMVTTDSDGWLRMSIDKGNQSTSGYDAVVVGNIAKDSDAGAGYALIFRNNRSARISARSAADGSLWLFFGTDSGFEGTTSIYYTRFTALLEPMDLTQSLEAIQGAFIGNYDTGSRFGQVSIRLAKGGGLTGALTSPKSKISLRGQLDVDGTTTLSISGVGTLQLSLFSSGLEDGQWNNEDTVYLSGTLNTGSEQIAVQCRPAARKEGPEAPLVGLSVNTLLESLSESGFEFGHGFARVQAGKGGIFQWSGALADGSKLTGSTNAVEDGQGGWKLPMAIAISSTGSFFHGETAIDSDPESGGFHLQSSAAAKWIRLANAKAKFFTAGFKEKLSVKGRARNWTKGTSALGGSSANFTLMLSAPSGFEIAAGAESLSGNLGASNKPNWSTLPPKAFTMKISPASGLVSGKLPGTLNGKAAVLYYQGLIFPSNMELDSGTPVRGAGFINGSTGSGTMEMVAP